MFTAGPLLLVPVAEGPEDFNLVLEPSTSEDFNLTTPAP